MASRFDPRSLLTGRFQSGSLLPGQLGLAGRLGTRLLFGLAAVLRLDTRALDSGQALLTLPLQRNRGVAQGGELRQPRLLLRRHCARGGVRGSGCLLGVGHRRPSVGCGVGGHLGRLLSLATQHVEGRVGTLSLGQDARTLLAHDFQAGGSVERLARTATEVQIELPEAGSTLEDLGGIPREREVGDVGVLLRDGRLLRCRGTVGSGEIGRVLGRAIRLRDHADPVLGGFEGSAGGGELCVQGRDLGGRVTDGGLGARNLLGTGDGRGGGLGQRSRKADPEEREGQRGAEQGTRGMPCSPTTRRHHRAHASPFLA